MDELFEKIIYRAIDKNATDIHMVLRNDLHIRFRIFGELSFYENFDNQNGSKLMNYIKYKSMINMNYKLLPQTGDFIIQINSRNYDLRVSYLPSTDLESIVIRILNNHEAISINELTYQEDIKEYLHWLTKQHSGLFLISGATGSGKSTTLYTLIDEIIKLKTMNIITIEDPIEVHKKECIQIELNDKLGITYEQTLRQILRHDPDVIMIGEIRDTETAKIAITCALTGHLVLTTIHASNASLALKRMINLGINKVDLEDVLLGSMSQRIRYDKENQKVIVLSELMDVHHIKQYFKDGILDYDNFCIQAKCLINHFNMNPILFKDDIYE